MGPAKCAGQAEREFFGAVGNYVHYVRVPLGTSGLTREAALPRMGEGHGVWVHRGAGPHAAVGP